MKAISQFGVSLIFLIIAQSSLAFEVINMSGAELFEAKPSQNKSETTASSQRQPAQDEAEKTPQMPQIRPENESKTLDFKSKTPQKKASYRPLESETSNLPDYFRGNLGEPGKGAIILPTKVNEELPASVRSGDFFQASIDHSVLAFLDERTPVVAKITSGNLRGFTLVGKSRLEANSRKIFIDFDQINKGTSEFQIKATFVDDFGSPGFQGEYYSREMIYASSDFLSTFMAAYFDSQIPRERNVFGQEMPDTSVDSAVKKGLSTSSLALAQRFKEKLMKAEAFSELKGPISGRVIILSARPYK